MDKSSERTVSWGKGRRPRDLAASTFLDYTQNTSLHGVKYIGNLKLHVCERLFWVVAFILAVMAATYFILNLFTKFRESPVILSLSPTTTKLSEIPFPALTICNMNNVRKSKADVILRRGLKLEKALIEDFCENNDNDIHNNSDERSAKWDFIQKMMVEVSQPCHEMLVSCFWHGDPLDCNDLFNPSLSDEGMCCSFNKLKRDLIFNNPRDLSDINVTFVYDSVDWKPETGYPPDTPATSLPWRPPGAGSYMGLTFVVDAELGEYFCSSENSVGFKILLHNPIETPKIAAFGTIISPGQENRLVIVPRIMTSNGLEGIDLEKRQCYYDDEKKLRFYRTYSQKNCILECEANFTLAYCKCVLYHMPKDKDTEICGRRDGICARDAEKIMSLSTLDKNITRGNFTAPKPCHCYPGCYEISYTITQSQSPLTSSLNVSSEFLNKRDKMYFKENMAIVHLFFVDTQFTGILRSRLFGFTEFLSNTGGLLGLFLGFSFLSAVEIGYYLSLKLWCKMSHQAKEVDDIHNEKDLFKHRAPFPFTQ